MFRKIFVVCLSMSEKGGACFCYTSWPPYYYPLSIAAIHLKTGLWQWCPWRLFMVLLTCILPGGYFLLFYSGSRFRLLLHINTMGRDGNGCGSRVTSNG